ncbi:hypothetical protein TNCV_4430421 [Trichonephila clavipes]|nr:hypothetical protein TNCV_4430421 [Trichonephila clavipes]
MGRGRTPDHTNVKTLRCPSACLYGKSSAALEIKLMTWRTQVRDHGPSTIQANIPIEKNGIKKNAVISPRMKSE